jgi:hypothetical protein
MIPEPELEGGDVHLDASATSGETGSVMQLSSLDTLGATSQIYGEAKRALVAVVGIFLERTQQQSSTSETDSHYGLRSVLLCTLRAGPRGCRHCPLL